MCAPQPGNKTLRNARTTTGRQIAMMTVAVVNVHGCVDKLVGRVAECLRQTEVSCVHRLVGLVAQRLRHAADRPSRFVFIGDYIDRGPDTRAVIGFLMALQRQKGEDLIALRGNHEAMMLKAVRTGDDALWLLNGAAQTLARDRKSVV